ncbi:MAG TPA: hypothetical protein VLI04_07735 [Nocardioidaceae bacterium]|nr:hypothetical protein [Nocardioidaceae bacterium]
MTRRARLGRHLRRHVVGYVALLIAVSMTPLPSWAAATIGTSDLKNGAVTTKKLAKNAVKTGKIGPSAVKAPKIAAGAVTAAKLGTITKRTAEVVIANAAGAAVSMECLAGETRLSGGTNTAGVGTSAGWALIRSGPSANGWTAAARNTTGGEGTLIVEVLCLG